MPVARHLRSLVCGCALSLAGCSLATADETGAVDGAATPDTVSDSRRGNICFGGIEDGKLIPNDDRVDNPFRQTTLLGCSIEGGQPVYLPDLKPAIPNGVMA